MFNLYLFDGNQSGANSLYYPEMWVISWGLHPKDVLFMVYALFMHYLWFVHFLWHLWANFLFMFHPLLHIFVYFFLIFH